MMLSHIVLSVDEVGDEIDATEHINLHFVFWWGHSWSFRDDMKSVFSDRLVVDDHLSMHR